MCKEIVTLLLFKLILSALDVAVAESADIDACASNPCLNNGTCGGSNGSFNCTCGVGYTGRTCATEIDECASKPCMNGGTCEDLVASFNCACPTGYTGRICETDTSSTRVHLTCSWKLYENLGYNYFDPKAFDKPQPQNPDMPYPVTVDDKVECVYDDKYAYFYVDIPTNLSLIIVEMHIIDVYGGIISQILRFPKKIYNITERKIEQKEGSYAFSSKTGERIQGKVTGDRHTVMIHIPYLEMESQIFSTIFDLQFTP